MTFPIRMLGLLAAVAGVTTAAASDWPRFRGPDGAGVANVPGLPVAWTERDFAWTTALPGIGHSSPVIRDGRLFVTSANADGTGRSLHCLDAAGGRLLWTKTLPLGTDKLHLKNSYASGTPAVGESRVFVAFADDERHVVAAYGFDGKLAWKKDLGGFASQHGHGASPIVYENLVIVPNDQDGPSTMTALDAATGNVVWSAPREVGRTSYSTPFVLSVEGHDPQLISSCDGMGVTSQNPRTGELNWKSGPLPQRTVGSPVYAGGLIYQTCGQGGRGELMIGVDPFAENGGNRIAFRSAKLLPYVPTPVACGGHLGLWNDNGVVICLDLKTHEPVWTERVGGTYSSSPICVSGHLYGVDEDGVVDVISAGPKFESLGKSSLGGRSHATPAVAEGRIYFRTFDKVICLKAKPSA